MLVRETSKCHDLSHQNSYMERESRSLERVVSDGGLSAFPHAIVAQCSLEIAIVPGQGCKRRVAVRVKALIRRRSPYGPESAFESPDLTISVKPHFTYLSTTFLKQ